MKTREELTALKQEYDALTTKLQELTEEELDAVIGGVDYGDTFILPDKDQGMDKQYAPHFYKDKIIDEDQFKKTFIG